MEKYYEQMRMIMQIIDTGVETLEYLVGRIDAVLEHQNSEQTAEEDQKEVSVPLYLIGDLAESYLTINRSMEEFIDELPPSQISDAADITAQKIDTLVEVVNQLDISKAKLVIEKELLPAHLQWRNAIADCFKPYIMS